jgi:hypothetical protein
MKLCLLCVGLNSCITHAFAPPLRAVALESPRILQPKQTAIAAAGSWGAGAGDLTKETVSVRVRRGIAARVEASLETNAFHYDTVQTTAALARAGVKYCPIADGRRCPLALTLGLGGGAYDHGVLFGGDGGAIVGFENPYLVPFLAGRLGFGVPVSARPVYDGSTCDSFPPAQPCGNVYNTPKADLVLGASLGLRWPVPPLGEHLSLLGAYDVMWMFDGDRDQVVHAIGWAGEVSF